MPVSQLRHDQLSGNLFSMQPGEHITQPRWRRCSMVHTIPEAALASPAPERETDMVWGGGDAIADHAVALCWRQDTEVQHLFILREKESERRMTGERRVELGLVCGGANSTWASHCFSLFVCLLCLHIKHCHDRTIRQRACSDNTRTLTQTKIHPGINLLNL